MALFTFKTMLITPEVFQQDQTRVSLYYTDIKYKMSVHIRDIHFFRDIDTIRKFQQRVYLLSQSRWVEDLVESEIIHSFVEWRELYSTAKFKLRVQSDQIDIYSNDLSVFTTLVGHLIDSYGEQITNRIKYRYARQIKNFEQNVVYQVCPKHKYRIYLSSERRSLEQIADFKKYLEKYKVFPSRSLKYWLSQDHTNNYYVMFSGIAGSWSWNHYSFDFDDEQLITLFLLSHDNWIGKVCRIEKKINTH